MNNILSAILGGLGGMGEWANMQQRLNLARTETERRQQALDADMKLRKEEIDLRRQALQLKQRDALYEDLPEGVDRHAVRRFAEQGLGDPFGLNTVDPAGAMRDIANDLGGRIGRRGARINQVLDGVGAAQGNVLEQSALLPGMQPLDRAKHYSELMGPREVAPGVNYTPAMDRDLRAPVTLALQAGQAIDRSTRDSGDSGVEDRAIRREERAEERRLEREKNERLSKGKGLLARYGSRTEPEYKEWKRAVVQLALDDDISEAEAAAMIGAPDRPKPEGKTNRFAPPTK